MSKQINHLTFLLVSDIHNSTENCKKVAQWLKDHSIKPDYILNSGDMTNIKVYDDDKINKESEDMVLQINNLLGEINPNVFYIPGNHDSKRLFDTSFILGDAKNIHQKVVEITSDLVLAGFGGSVPAYNLVDGKEVWKGYPFHSENDFIKDFTPVEEQLAKHKDKSVILMTHNGPSESSTILYQKDIGAPKILSGCTHLAEYIKSKDSQLNVVCNIHGHTHLGHGRCQIGKVQIVNPGSLMENRFGIMYLDRDSNSKWYLSRTEHIFLQ